MKHAFEKQITVGLLATMLVATSKKEDVPPAQGSGAAGTAARPNRLNLPPRESPVPGQGIGVRGEAESELAPYLNKTVTKISVEGNAEVPSEDILRAVYSKPGLPLTEEDISRDMQAIYGMGWFYEIQPSFQTVPEGVQVTYHVQENPKFDHLEVTGNTKVSTDKIRQIVNVLWKNSIRETAISLPVSRMSVLCLTVFWPLQSMKGS